MKVLERIFRPKWEELAPRVVTGEKE